MGGGREGEGGRGGKGGREGEGRIGEEEGGGRREVYIGREGKVKQKSSTMKGAAGYVDVYIYII